jgi:hypothetical protein
MFRLTGWELRVASREARLYALVGKQSLEQPHRKGTDWAEHTLRL